MLALLLLAVDPAAPVPGPIKTFVDRAVACDNIHRCETSLTPDRAMVDGTGGRFTVGVAVPDSAKGEISVGIDDKVIGGGVRNGAITNVIAAGGAR